MFLNLRGRSFKGSWGEKEIEDARAWGEEMGKVMQEPKYLVKLWRNKERRGEEHGKVEEQEKLRWRKSCWIVLIFLGGSIVCWGSSRVWRREESRTKRFSRRAVGFLILWWLIRTAPDTHIYMLCFVKASVV